MMTSTEPLRRTDRPIVVIRFGGDVSPEASNHFLSRPDYFRLLARSEFALCPPGNCLGDSGVSWHPAASLPTRRSARVRLSPPARRLPTRRLPLTDEVGDSRFSDHRAG